MNYIEITSRKNPKITEAALLRDKKARDEKGLFFTEGAKLLEEVCLAKLKVQKVFFTKAALEKYEALLESVPGAEMYLTDDSVYDKLTSEIAPQGIFAVAEKKKDRSFSEDELKEGGFILLEDVQNPSNLGAIIRCAFSLGATKLILTHSCADPYNPKTVRSAMGSLFKADFSYCTSMPDMADKLTSLGVRVICTALREKSEKLGSFAFNDSDCIIIGSEGHGASKETIQSSTASLVIPMNENAESLNAATAAAIVIWEMKRSSFSN